MRQSLMPRGHSSSTTSTAKRLLLDERWELMRLSLGIGHHACLLAQKRGFRLAMGVISIHFVSTETDKH